MMRLESLSNGVWPALTCSIVRGPERICKTRHREVRSYLCFVTRASGSYGSYVKLVGMGDLGLGISALLIG
jgi:hypothetical protein